MSDLFNRSPRPVPPVDTRFRRIVTDLPAPGSRQTLQDLEEYEPRSMTGQPPVVWDHAEGFQVYDEHGNMWLDWSSGVLVANVGHANPRVNEAIIDQVRQGLTFSYCFPTKIRAKLVRKLVNIAPPQLDKAFLLTTGAETTETAIKLALTYARKTRNPERSVIISFERAFHGRTLGAQLAGGDPEAKTWIPNPDPDFIQVPFPDGFHCTDTGFDLFLRSLETRGIAPRRVAAVIMETFQGGGASFAPPEYVHNLRRWCDENGVLLIFDEVQSAFGRTGRMFAFEHYDTVPDLVCLAKGISGSLPLSAVLGRREIMDLYEPGSMTSTHGGNPVSCAAALANIDYLLEHDVIAAAAETGAFLGRGLADIAARHREITGAVHGKGMVYGLHIVKAGSREPDRRLAARVVELCYQKGLLMFAPVGYGGATIKICPPLTITKAALKEGLEVLDCAFDEALQNQDGQRS